jgi:glycosyltransferase involved in cell wall biosynthesis
MTEARGLHVLLVDPSLFTAPYDAALSRGLLEVGVTPVWAVRPTRKGDQRELPETLSDEFFYKHVDDIGLPRAPRAVAKGFAHAAGLVKLVFKVARRRPDVVHFQWAVIPLLDAVAMSLIRRFCPVVFTVHDSVAFNGEKPSRFQTLATRLPVACANRVIVHTQASRATLVARGVPGDTISVISHGPLSLKAHASPPKLRIDLRWTFVLFGELKHYKGIDSLIEALAHVPSALLRQARVIIAGRARMDLSGVVLRIEQLGLNDVVELRQARLSEAEMAELFSQADCFVFPYRQIDASGVYCLVKALGKWIIASRLGLFAEELHDGQRGVLVPPDDPRALASAIARAIVERPTPRALPASSSWTQIAASTRAVYQGAIEGAFARRERRHAQPSKSRASQVGTPFAHPAQTKVGKS